MSLEVVASRSEGIESQVRAEDHRGIRQDRSSINYRGLDVFELLMGQVMINDQNDYKPRWPFEPRESAQPG